MIGRRPWPMLQDYDAVIRSKQVIMVLAEAAGEIAGVLVLSESAEGFLLDNVAVAPSFQGLGVGRALLEHAEQVARERTRLHPLRRDASRHPPCSKRPLACALASSSTRYQISRPSGLRASSRM